MKKINFIFILFCIAFTNVNAQDNSDVWRLGHWLSAEEMLRKDEIGRGFVETDPPVGPLRNFAEFDKIQGALVRYPFGIPVELIREMSEDIMVTTIVANSSQQATVTQQYQNAGVNMANTNFLITPSDSYWTRDYGPWFSSDSSNNIGIVDFPYNRPRPNDDDVPKKVADMLGLPWYGMNLIHTGGNYMTDGYGISSSTTLVHVENPTLTPTQVLAKVHDYLGIENYMVIEDPNGTYIDHIDCWGKFLAPDKVLIRQVPPSNPQYDEVEAVAAYFASQQCSYGYNYKVFRVYTPNGQPYTNSVILNNKVLVPIMNSSWDDTALAAYSVAMPGYEIIGITGNPSTPWEATDAIHCRVMGIADLDQLFIKHIPLTGNQPAQDNFLIEADLVRYSDSAAYADSVLIWYNVNGGNYKLIHMNQVSGDHYSAYIPKQVPGSEIQYYLYAADKSGEHATCPFIGAADPFTFNAVYTDITAVPDTLWFKTYDDAYMGKESYLHNYTGSAIDVISMDDHGILNTMPGLWYTNNPFPSYPATIESGDSVFLMVKFAIGKKYTTTGYSVDTLNYATVPGQHRIIIMVNDSLELVLGQKEKKITGITRFFNYPNPFKSTTTVTFELETTSDIRISVFNTMGKEISVVTEGNYPSGNYNETFSAGTINPGVYFIRLTTSKGSITKKMLLVR